MKRFLTLLLGICMLMNLSACGDSEAADPVVEEDPVVAETPAAENTPSSEALTGSEMGYWDSNIRDFDYTLSGNCDANLRDDGKIELRDYDLGVGINFPGDLEYSNDVVPGALLISDLNNSFQVIRSVTDEVHDIDNYGTPVEMMADFFDEYALGDFELLFGESGIYYGYDDLEVESGSSALAIISGSIISNNYDMMIRGTFHSSAYVNGMTGYVVKFTYCPTDGEEESGIWGRNGLDTMACERKVDFGMGDKNNWEIDHPYEIDGKYDIEKTEGNLWQFTDGNKRVGLKFPEGLDFSNMLIPDAVLVSDLHNAYVVARNMTSEYLDYDYTDEEFQLHLLENYLLEDFITLYEQPEQLGALRYKYYDSDSNILCTAETRIQSESFDINVRTDLLAKELQSGQWCVAILTRYSPYGSLNHSEIWNDVRIVYMEPYKG